jgi:hypothetical protein
LNTIYDPEAVLISDGYRTDMVLKSNKLIYLFKYEGMDMTDVEHYLDSENNLLYLINQDVSGTAYQVYINLKYLYNEDGDMISPLAENSWQNLVIPEVFINENLSGKVVKVW